MPIYEYECKKCGESFEQLVFGGEEFVRCPRCGSRNIDRLMSCTHSFGDDSGAGCSPRGFGGFG